MSIEAFAEPARLQELISALRARGPVAATIDELSEEPIPAEDLDSFTIVESEHGADRCMNIPPDLATCDECLRELFDPGDRRFLYPFINCTHCGPRYTIVREVPYDRPATTMAQFEMCLDCAREYESVDDRRFHAEPIACAACGPRLSTILAGGTQIFAGDPIETAARALREGQILAVKGLGGFHLACDATNQAAVQELRKRKRREEKPFAIMVRDLAEAELVAVFGAAEREILSSIARPIVLLPKRSGVAAAVAPATPRIGVMLPYTPLHHLLLRAAGGPLVMTSANLSDQPIVAHNEAALDKLSGIADLFLLHDREIAARCDDSVVTVVAGAAVPVRRSRGFVPRAIRLRRAVAQPILAAGGQLKNTFCVASGESAYLGPHVGDLDDVETMEVYESSIARVLDYLAVKPAAIAHDLHPAYQSTIFARKYGVPAIGVQHHHAHVVSAMAEHGLEGPVLGVAYDGTGYGADGTSWGGELLLANYSTFKRVATFKPIALPGGDLAVREIWRIAYSVLVDAFGTDVDLRPFPVFSGIGEKERRLVSRMVSKRLNTPPARGVGRWFDAFAALGLGRASVSFEGQAAMAWEEIAEPGNHGAYHFTIDPAQSPWTIDLLPAVRDAARDLVDHTPPGIVSARFHATLARATAATVTQAISRLGPRPVVLTGGCFQNALLTELLLQELGGAVTTHVHRQVPPGDGGLALGQALVADAIVRSGT